MSKLFEVEITISVVVQADDIADALSVALENKRDIISDIDSDCFRVYRPIVSSKSLPDGWECGFLPFGGDGRTTIADILENQPAAPCTATADMFAGVVP